MPGSWGMLGSVSVLIGDLPALDHDVLAVADGDPEPAVAVDQLGGAARAVDRDRSATEEVARTEAVVDGVETAHPPLLVARAERVEHGVEHRVAVPLQPRRRPERAPPIRQLLARLIDVDTDSDHDRALARLGENARHLRPPQHDVVR